MEDWEQDFNVADKENTAANMSAFGAAGNCADVGIRLSCLKIHLEDRDRRIAELERICAEFEEELR